MRRILLGTPTLFRVPTLEYMMSVMKTSQLCQQYGIAIDTAFVGGDCFISKARNGLVQSFINTWGTPFEADTLVFLDDDQAWDEQAFLRMLLDPHEFVCAAVPKKVDAKPGEAQTFNNVLLDTDDKGNCIIENGLMRTSQIGSGFIMMKKSCIEKMIAAYPRKYRPGDGGLHQLHYALFESKVVWDETDPTKDGQFWGEDLIFCQKWKAIGGEIWLDPNVMMQHVGRKIYEGNFLHFLQKHANVTTTMLPPKSPTGDNVLPLAQPVATAETVAAIKELAAAAA